MANIKLYGNTWDTSGIYDETQSKTQSAINADVVAQSEQIKAFEKEKTISDYNITGVIRVSDGYVVSGTTRLTSKNAFNARKYHSAKTLTGYSFSMAAWDGDTYIGTYRSGEFKKTAGTGFITEFDFTQYPLTYKYILNIKRDDNEDISLEEASNIIYSVNIVEIDATLSVSGDAADAKVVGDAIALKANTSDLLNSRSNVSMTPYGGCTLSGAMDFRDMPMNSYRHTTFANIKSGFSDTSMPEDDWGDNDTVCIVKKAAGSSTTLQNAIIELYNYIKTRHLVMLYFATSSGNKYRWLEEGVTKNYTNNYTIEQFSNTYTVTATPSITTDTNNYLASTGDTTDVSSSIITMLTQTGICNLGPGDFYVSGIDMPNQSTLRGCGYKTRIILLDSVTDGYAIKMGTQCTVESLSVLGSTSSITITETVGTRHGILWQGAATSQQSVVSDPERGTISNVHVRYFSGGGITLYGTGTGINNCLNVVNAYIYNCTVGLNIVYFAEFNRFTNIHARGCYYGCINNGGNNVISASSFSKNTVGILMDNSTGQSPNNSHGTFDACVINHSGADNDGIAIKILNMNAGEMFVGCQVFYGSIVIEDSTGIAFTGCNFKASVPISYEDSCVIFTGCVFGGNPTITKTGTNTVKNNGSYLRDGTDVTLL